MKQRVRIKRDVTHHIRPWRKKRGMGIVELGRLSDVSASMISQLENGKANYTQVTLEAIAAALWVPAWVLLAGPPEELILITTPLANLRFPDEGKCVGTV